MTIGSKFILEKDIPLTHSDSNSLLLAFFCSFLCHQRVFVGQNLHNSFPPFNSFRMERKRKMRRRSFWANWSTVWIITLLIIRYKMLTRIHYTGISTVISRRHWTVFHDKCIAFIFWVKLGWHLEGIFISNWTLKGSWNSKLQLSCYLIKVVWGVKYTILKVCEGAAVRCYSQNCSEQS